MGKIQWAKLADVQPPAELYENEWGGMSAHRYTVMALIDTGTGNSWRMEELSVYHSHKEGTDTGDQANWYLTGFDRDSANFRWDAGEQFGVEDVTYWAELNLPEALPAAQYCEECEDRLEPASQADGEQPAYYCTACAALLRKNKGEFDAKLV